MAVWVSLTEVITMSPLIKIIESSTNTNSPTNLPVVVNVYVQQTNRWLHNLLAKLIGFIIGTELSRLLDWALSVLQRLLLVYNIQEGETCLALSQFKTGKLIFRHTCLLTSCGFAYKCLKSIRTTPEGNIQFLVTTLYAYVPFDKVPWYLSPADFRNLPLTSSVNYYLYSNGLHNAFCY